MHEQSIANNLIDIVLETLIDSGADGARRVVVEVGELSGVDPAALASAWRIARSAEAGVQGAELEIRVVPVTLYCNTCECERPAQSMRALRCRVCHAASTTVVRGRELDVLSIEVMDAATNA